MVFTSNVVKVPYGAELIEYMPELETAPPEPVHMATVAPPVDEHTPPAAELPPPIVKQPTPKFVKDEDYLCPAIPPLPEGWGPPGDLFSDLRRILEPPPPPPPPPLNVDDSFRQAIALIGGVFTGVAMSLLFVHFFSKQKLE